MTTVSPHAEVLSREEISALVDELARARREEAEAQRLPGMAGSAASSPRAGRALRRTCERFAADETRALASRFQRQIEVRLLSIDELRMVELVEHLLPHERMVSFGSEESGESGLLLVARPLLFAWMRLAFGARSELQADALPDRPPTPIETRFLRRVAGDLVERFGRAFVPPLSFALHGLLDPSAVSEERAARLLVASFDVSGLEELGRLRIVLPRDRDPLHTPSSTDDEHGPAVLEQAVLDARVRVAAVLGSVELPLARVAQIAVGDVIEVDAGEDGLIGTSVAGVVKYRAVRGQVGSRLAVQIVAPVAGEEE